MLASKIISVLLYQQSSSALTINKEAASKLICHLEVRIVLLSATRAEIHCLESEDSRDEAFKQREAAVKEVGILRGELQQVREDRERQLLLVQQLNSQLARFEENIGCTVAEVGDLFLSKRTNIITTISVGCLAAANEMAAANEKLKSFVKHNSALPSPSGDLKPSHATTVDIFRPPWSIKTTQTGTILKPTIDEYCKIHKQLISITSVDNIYFVLPFDLIGARRWNLPLIQAYLIHWARDERVGINNRPIVRKDGCWEVTVFVNGGFKYRTSLSSLDGPRWPEDIHRGRMRWFKVTRG
ncbi:hypothetical protein Tco_0834509 [Tanacetum coccineum]